MLRNIDAAWDDRGDRKLVVLFAVEGQDPDRTRLPRQ
jgi:hypothetical protein